MNVDQELNRPTMKFTTGPSVFAVRVEDVFASGCRGCQGE